jgi:hypothetical protein
MMEAVKTSETSVNFWCAAYQKTVIFVFTAVRTGNLTGKFLNYLSVLLPSEE